MVAPPATVSLPVPSITPLMWVREPESTTVLAPVSSVPPLTWNVPVPADVPAPRLNVPALKLAVAPEANVKRLALDDPPPLKFRPVPEDRESVPVLLVTLPSNSRVPDWTETVPVLVKGAWMYEMP